MRKVILGSLCLATLAGCNLVTIDKGIVSVKVPDWGEITFDARAYFSAQTPVSPDDSNLLGIRPTSVKVAVKNLVLVSSDGKTVPFFTSPNLAASKVLSFTPEAVDVPISSTSIPPGNYTGVNAELFYVQTTIPVDGSLQNLRVYLSDDDFPTETLLGAGPHHQGDVTFIDDAGRELGWVHQGPNAFTPAPRSNPPAEINYFATDRDPATGHDRGPFGNNDLWGKIPANQPFRVEQLLDKPLVLEKGSKKHLFFTLDVPSAWRYEDVDHSGTFNPAAGKDANGTAWAPVIPLFRFENL